MKKVSHIIFDVDGTLYESIPQLSQRMHDYTIQQVMMATNTQYSKAEEIYKTHIAKLSSTTAVLSELGLGTPQMISKKVEHHMRPVFKKYILKDRTLIHILRKLKHQYTLGTLRNGTRAGTCFILSLLGFSPRLGYRSQGYGPFDHIFPTVELGTVKPDPRPFTHILEATGVDPSQIVVIGDREAVDLRPAKKLGMQTVLVQWDKKSTYDKDSTDMVIDSIYDVKQLID